MDSILYDFLQESEKRKNERLEKILYKNPNIKEIITYWFEHFIGTCEFIVWCVTTNQFKFSFSYSFRNEMLRNFRYEEKYLSFFISNFLYYEPENFKDIINIIYGPDSRELELYIIADEISNKYKFRKIKRNFFLEI